MPANVCIFKGHVNPFPEQRRQPVTRKKYIFVKNNRNANKNETEKQTENDDVDAARICTITTELSVSIDTTTELPVVLLGLFLKERTHFYLRPEVCTRLKAWYTL